MTAIAAGPILRPYHRGRRPAALLARLGSLLHNPGAMENVDALTMVFAELPVADRQACRAVCQAWRRAANSPASWQVTLARAN